jgi:CRISPR-associated protein Cas2
MSGRVHYVVAYDIADDERRDDVSLFLSGYGPRVQLSVFEVELASAEAAAAFRDRLRTLIDPDDDQIRLYRLTRDSLTQRLIFGNRTLEERVDFWIV